MIRFKECRENAHLSQKYVAITLGVAPPSVSNWETGKTNPAHENLVKLADLNSVSVDYLLGVSDEPNEPQNSSDTQHTPEGITIQGAVDRMPAADRQKALEVMRVVFAQYAEYF